MQFGLGTLAVAEHKYKDAEDIFRKLDSTAAGDPQVLTGVAEAYNGENEPGKAIHRLLFQPQLEGRWPPLIRAVLRGTASSFSVFPEGCTPSHEVAISGQGLVVRVGKFPDERDRFAGTVCVFPG